MAGTQPKGMGAWVRSNEHLKAKTKMWLGAKFQKERGVWVRETKLGNKSNKTAKTKLWREAEKQI